MTNFSDAIDCPAPFRGSQYSKYYSYPTYTFDFTDMKELNGLYFKVPELSGSINFKYGHNFTVGIYDIAYEIGERDGTPICVGYSIGNPVRPLNSYSYNTNWNSAAVIEGKRMISYPMQYSLKSDPFNYTQFPIPYNSNDNLMANKSVYMPTNNTLSQWAWQNYLTNKAVIIDKPSSEDWLPGTSIWVNPISGYTNVGAGVGRVLFGYSVMHNPVGSISAMVSPNEQVSTVAGISGVANGGSFAATYYNPTTDRFGNSAVGGNGAYYYGVTNAVNNTKPQILTIVGQNKISDYDFLQYTTKSMPTYGNYGSTPTNKMLVFSNYIESFTESGTFVDTYDYYVKMRNLVPAMGIMASNDYPYYHCDDMAWPLQFAFTDSPSVSACLNMDETIMVQRDFTGLRMYNQTTSSPCSANLILRPKIPLYFNDTYANNGICHVISGGSVLYAGTNWMLVNDMRSIHATNDVNIPVASSGFYPMPDDWVSPDASPYLTVNSTLMHNTGVPIGDGDIDIYVRVQRTFNVLYGSPDYYYQHPISDVQIRLHVPFYDTALKKWRLKNHGGWVSIYGNRISYPTATVPSDHDAAPGSEIFKHTVQMSDLPAEYLPEGCKMFYVAARAFRSPGGHPDITYQVPYCEPAAASNIFKKFHPPVYPYSVSQNFLGGEFMGLVGKIPSSCIDHPAPEFYQKNGSSNLSFTGDISGAYITLKLYTDVWHELPNNQDYHEHNWTYSGTMPDTVFSNRNTFITKYIKIVSDTGLRAAFNYWENPRVLPNGSQLVTDASNTRWKEDTRNVYKLPGATCYYVQLRHTERLLDPLHSNRELGGYNYTQSIWEWHEVWKIDCTTGQITKIFDDTDRLDFSD